MKKSMIWILVTVTLIFVSFVGGVYVGRNFSHSDIHVISPTTNTPTTPSGSASQPSGGQVSNEDSTISTTPTTPTTVPVYPININTATVQQLDLLPEIGPVLAQRIVDYRNEFGPYTCAEDLLNVNGIGQKTLAKILSLITV